MLANSLGTRQQLWSRQLPELTERFRVLTYDHPGHGTSALPEEPYTVEGFARGLLELLDELAFERVSICGTSLGGMVGMALALEAPERVERLVLSCTSAYLGPPDGWAERARTVRADRMGAIADSVVVRWFTPELAREQPETVARFRAMLVGTPPEGYACCCEALAVWDARERISAISVPTLVIAGAEDRRRRSSTPTSSHPASRTRGFSSSSARPTSRTSSVRRSSPTPCWTISERRCRCERRGNEDKA